MNSDQRKVLVYSSYALAAVLILIFWRLGTQYDYNGSLLILELGKRDAPRWLLPEGEYGLRLRLGGVGVLLGAILPAVLVGVGTYLDKASKD